SSDEATLPLSQTVELSLSRVTWISYALWISLPSGSLGIHPNCGVPSTSSGVVRSPTVSPVGAVGGLFAAALLAGCAVEAAPSVAQQAATTAPAVTALASRPRRDVLVLILVLPFAASTVRSARLPLLVANERLLRPQCPRLVESIIHAPFHRSSDRA